MLPQALKDASKLKLSDNEERNVATISVERTGDEYARLTCAGEWRNSTVPPVLGVVQAFCTAPRAARVEIDLDGIEGIDTTGAWLLRRMMNEGSRQGAVISLLGGSDTMRELINALPDKCRGRMSVNGCVIRCLSASLRRSAK